MSDSICSVLGFDIEGTSTDEWLRCIDERVKKLTGKSENLVFGYDEIDNIYSKAWAKYAEGDYYKSLSIALMQENWTESSLSIIRTFGLKRSKKKLLKVKMCQTLTWRCVS